MEIAVGVTAHFEYNGCDTLAIKFTKLPFFISSDLANSKLDAFITQFIPE
jgi:hypothetical protein